MNIIWTYFLLGTLGLIVQTCIKISALQRQSRVANHVFSFKEYFRDDWITILGSMATVALAVLTIDEWLPLSKFLSEYVKVFFAFVGFTGSSIIQAVFSVYSKKLLSIIDIKTNIADGVKPSIDAGNVDGVKEIVKDKEKLNNPLN